MNHFFLDESGEFSFEATSIYKHGLITIVSVDHHNRPKIKNRFKRKFGDFITRGWPKSKEIKASDLFSDRAFGADAVSEVLQILPPIHSLRVHYIIVNKQNLKSPSLRTAPYGIAYNYFAGTLLTELIYQNRYHMARLTYDERNKESHDHMPFKEYLLTHIYTTAFDKKILIDFAMRGEASNKCYGLNAVDFCSWAIFRKYEYGDSRFYNQLKNIFGRQRRWYV